MSATPTQFAGRDRIQAKLRNAWQRRQRAVHLAGLARAMMMLAPAALALFALDWLLDLPLAARIVLLLGALGFVGWQLHRHWWRRLQPFDAMAWALRVEQVFPQLNSLLISYVQLAQPTPAATGSPVLIDVVRQQAERMASPLDFTQTVSFDELKPLFKRAAIALAALLIVVAIVPSHVSAALWRYAGFDVAYPTATQFVSVPEDVRIGQGEALSLDAQVAGQIPVRSQVWVRPEGGQWRSVWVDIDEQGHLAYAVESVTVGFEYYLEAGDARSHGRGAYGRVEVVPPPHIEQQQVTVTPPGYTGQERYEAASLAGAVPAGSTLDVAITVDRPLKQGVLLDAEDNVIAGELDDDGRTLHFALSPESDQAYRFKLTAVELDMTFTSDPYRLRLIPDMPPSAMLLEPETNIKATPQKMLRLVVKATDDYGLSEMAILFRLNEQEHVHRVPLGKPPVPAAQEGQEVARSGTWPINWQIISDVPQIKPGDRLHVSMEVTEHADSPENARTARTDERLIEVLSLPDYQRYIVSQLKMLRTRVGEAEKTQRVISHEVESLRQGEQP